MVGRVIGKSGETIKALQKHFGCNIQIDQAVQVRLWCARLMLLVSVRLASRQRASAKQIWRHRPIPECSSC